jgi:thioredoxin 1
MYFKEGGVNIMAINYATDNNYEELINEDFVIVDFYSTTCVPCKLFSKVLEGLEAEIPFLNIVKVNTTDYPKLRHDNNIEAVPTIIFFKDGKQVDRHLGFMTADQVKEITAQYMY